MPPLLVAFAFLLAVGAALALMAYIAWRGSKPSSFFLEAVNETYELELPEMEIRAYFELKESVRKKHITPEEIAALEAAEEDEDGEPPVEAWIRRVPPEQLRVLKMALMRRLVGCFDKLDQVQRDKPGNWKLWRGKLVSERYWASLCEAERLVSEEIDSCVVEAEFLEPGWRQNIFPQAVQVWKMQKQQQMEQKEAKMAVESEKYKKERDEKMKELEERKKVEDKIREEKEAEKQAERLIKEEEAAKARERAAAAPKSKSKKK